MDFFAPSRVSDFFSMICADAVIDVAAKMAKRVEIVVFIRHLSRLAGHLLGVASQRSMLFDRVIEGGFAEVCLGKRAPNLYLGYVGDVLRDDD